MGVERFYKRLDMEKLLVYLRDIILLGLFFTVLFMSLPYTEKVVPSREYNLHVADYVVNKYSIDSSSSYDELVQLAVRLGARTDIKLEDSKFVISIVSEEAVEPYFLFSKPTFNILTPKSPLSYTTTEDFIKMQDKELYNEPSFTIADFAPFKYLEGVDGSTYYIVANPSFENVRLLSDYLIKRSNSIIGIEMNGTIYPFQVSLNSLNKPEPIALPVSSEPVYASKIVSVLNSGINQDINYEERADDKSVFMYEVKEFVIFAILTIVPSIILTLYRKDIISIISIIATAATYLSYVKIVQFMDSLESFILNSISLTLISLISYELIIKQKRYMLGTIISVTSVIVLLPISIQMKVFAMLALLVPIVINDIYKEIIYV